MRETTVSAALVEATRRPRKPGPETAAATTGDASRTIEPLTPDRFADLAALFEEGGDPKWCWCTYFRFRGRDWSNSTAAGNRRRAAGADRARTSRRASSPTASDRAVGWVSLGPREDYDRLAYSKVLAPVDDTPVWSIVCFVVSRRVRGQGVAAALLDAAIDYARDHGATILEAYPVDTGERPRPGRERLPRHAADVRTGRLQGRRTAPVEQVDARSARSSGSRRELTAGRTVVRPG